MRVGIAGAGGIGSNVARYLAQAGVASIRVADFDQVEASNLNRQFYRTDQVGKPKVNCLKENLTQIFPDMDVEILHQKILPGESLDLFRDCGLVVEGFDDPVAKKYLVEELASANIPLVCASGIAGRDMGNIRIRKLGNSYIVGDFSTDIDDAPLFPPKIGIVAAMMAGVVLERVRGSEKT